MQLIYPKCDDHRSFVQTNVAMNEKCRHSDLYENNDVFFFLNLSLFLVCFVLYFWALLIFSGVEWSSLLEFWWLVVFLNCNTSPPDFKLSHIQGSSDYRGDFLIQAGCICIQSKKSSYILLSQYTISFKLHYSCHIIYSICRSIYLNTWSRKPWGQKLSTLTMDQRHQRQRRNTLSFTTTETWHRPFAVGDSDGMAI